MKGPTETHGLALGTSGRWILPMQEDTLVCVCPGVCPEESLRGMLLPWESHRGSFLLLPSPAFRERNTKWASSHYLSTKESVISCDTNGML